MLFPLERLIETTPRIAALPQSTAALLDVIDDPAVGTDKLVPIVEMDPGLTANLLKLCNSSAYGMSRQVGSVQEALVRVGNRTFIRLAFALSLEQMLHGNLPGYRLSVGELWQHALSVACGAADLIETMGHGRIRERVFTIGLLHDIGKLVLDRVLVDKLPLIQELADEVNLLEIERDISGYDHSQAGALLLEKWHFPETIVESIRFHHNPEKAIGSPEVTLAVHAANQIAHFPRMGDEVLGPDDVEALNGLIQRGLSESTIRSVCQAMPSETQDLLSMALGVA